MFAPALACVGSGTGSVLEKSAAKSGQAARGTPAPQKSVVSSGRRSLHATGILLEAYRAKLKSDPESRENFSMAETKRIILREERTFVEAVDGTFEIPSRM